MSYPQQPPRFPDDNLNPYASPRGEIGAMPYEPTGESDIPPTIEGVLGYAWAIFKERWGICVRAMVLFMAIIYGYQIATALIPGLIDAGQPRPTPVSGLVRIVLALIGYGLQFWMTAGLTLVMLRVARRQQAAIGDLFAGGPYFWRVLGANFFFGLAIFGLVMVCMVPLFFLRFAGGVGNQGNSFPMFMVLLIIPLAVVLVFFGIRLSQFTYLIVDRGAGATESLRLSMELTKGRSGLILGLGLVTLLINLGGLLAIGLGLIATVPFSMLTFAVLYLAIRGGPTNLDGRRLEAGDYVKPLPEPDFR